jgi:hypothetical protein
MESILNFIEEHNWKFAKSMPNTPHWYIVREECNDADFVKFVEYIKDNGYPKKFFRSTFTYLDIGNYSYWSMRDPIEIAPNMPRIINRALIS